MACDVNLPDPESDDVVPELELGEGVARGCCCDGTRSTEPNEAPN